MAMTSRLRAVAIAGFAVLSLTNVVSAEEIAVSTSGELGEAYSAAQPGDVLRLEGGEYGTLVLKGGGGASGAPVTIASADPNDPARLAGFTLKGVAHVVLSDLLFDYSFAAGQEGWFRPFQLLDVENVTIRSSLFDGDVARGLGPAADGFPTGFGLGITGAEGVDLRNNEIRGFFRGVVVADSRDVKLVGNDIHSLRMDGLNFAQVERVVIEENRIHDFDRSPNSKDHADMIQFWTNGTDAPSRDITIRNNILNSGAGLYTQSIFMRNDQVDRGLAGDEMYYRNVKIEGNVISNAHLHGITVGETDGLTIANNTVIRNAGSEGEADNPTLWTPQIRVAETARNVEIVRNVTAKIAGAGGQSDWRLADNVMVQDTARMKPGHYGTVFEGDPADLSSMHYLRGGTLDGAGIGAPHLNR